MPFVYVPIDLLSDAHLNGMVPLLVSGKSIVSCMGSLVARESVTVLVWSNAVMQGALTTFGRLPQVVYRRQTRFRVGSSWP